MIGIYKITNKINGKIYVGQSNCIQRRFAQHKSPYEQQRFSNKPLYKAFKKYGIQNFSFEVIEQCSQEQLNTREKFWIKTLHSLCHQNGYNITAGGDGPQDDNHPKHKLTREDVIDIRKRYARHQRCKDVQALYKNKIGHSGFSKVWKGETWKDIMPEIYTKENKQFHKHNTGQKGSQNGRSLLTENDVRNIRLRKKLGQSWKQVYEDYKFTGITKDSFYNIWQGYNWKNVVV